MKQTHETTSATGGEPKRTGANAYEQPAVLIPFGYTSGYQCLRSFNRRDVRTILGTPEQGVPESASRYCDETRDLPSSEDDIESYGDALLEVAARPDVRTIVPLQEPESYVLSKRKSEFERYVDISVPSFDSLRRVQDRLRLVAAAEEAGVPVPETRRLDEIRTVDTELIVKSRYNILTDEYVDSFGKGDSQEVNGIEYLAPGDEPDVEALRDEMNHVPIAQEFVPRGDEYMVGALCDRGEPLATVQLHQIRESSYIGGGGVYRESVYIEELEEVARRLLRHLDWHGLACIEYMEDAHTGEFKLAEINPRLWQSTPTAVRAGADFPYYYWLHAMGQSHRIDPEYELGIGTHYLKGELGHLISILRDDCPFVERPAFNRRLREIAWSCWDHPEFDYLRLDDPLPFARDFYEMTKSAASTLAPI